MSVLLETDLPSLYARGKVRDTYDLGDRLLMVATDRISAYDVLLPTGIPDKGAVLTQLSAFWFKKLADIIPNHFLELVTPETVGEIGGIPFRELPDLWGRSMIVKKAQRIDIECVVRGYLAGSAWQEYQELGSASGQMLPPGLHESDKLVEPIFTPATKADTGHDENISVERMYDLVGEALGRELMMKSLEIYRAAADYALERGIIIADTKFEFGLLDGQVIWIDEALTPDSSRFWEAATYEPGKSQPSFDKQFVRDWLTSSGWNKEPPAPSLPTEVANETSRKYREAFRRLTGHELVRYD